MPTRDWTTGPDVCMYTVQGRMYVCTLYRAGCMYVQGRMYVCTGPDVCMYRAGCMYVLGRMYVCTGPDVCRCRAGCMYVQGRMYVCTGRMYLLFSCLFLQHFITNSKLLPIFLQPDYENLWYFNLWFFIHSLKYQMFTTLGCKDKGNIVCGKDSNPSRLAASENILFFLWRKYCPVWFDQAWKDNHVFVSLRSSHICLRN